MVHRQTTNDSESIQNLWCLRNEWYIVINSLYQYIHIFDGISYCLRFNLLEIIFNSKSTTKINKMFVYLPQQILVWCLRPPLGGTLTTVPSNNLIKSLYSFQHHGNRWLLFTGDFVYFINKNDSSSALATFIISCLKPDVKILSTSTSKFSVNTVASTMLEERQAF
jgi:hypothetical protein